MESDLSHLKGEYCFFLCNQSPLCLESIILVFCDTVESEFIISINFKEKPIKFNEPVPLTYQNLHSLTDIITDQKSNFGFKLIKINVG